MRTILASMFRRISLWILVALGIRCHCSGTIILAENGTRCKRCGKRTISINDWP
jgi:hypothetical protein